MLVEVHVHELEHEGEFSWVRGWGTGGLVEQDFDELDDVLVVG